MSQLRRPPLSLDDASLMLMLTIQLYPKVKLVLCDLSETHIKRRFVIVSWPCSPLLPLVSSIWLYSRGHMHGEANKPDCIGNKIIVPCYHSINDSLA